MTHKIPTIGSRIQVYRGHAKKTSGGLTKSDLMMNKHGRVVSKAKHFTAKKEMRLLKHGYGTKKGKFGFVKIGKKSRSRKMKGGMLNLSPQELSDGAGITDFGKNSTSVQIRAGMSGGSGLRPMGTHAPADWNGDNMSGGRHRASARSRSRGRSLAQQRTLALSKSRGLAMMGGTGNRGAAGLGSDAVQIRAGLGN